MAKNFSTICGALVTTVILSTGTQTKPALGQERVPSVAEGQAHSLVTAYFVGVDAALHLQRLQQLSTLDVTAVERALAKLTSDSRHGLAQVHDDNALAFASAKIGADAALARSSLSRALLTLGGKLPSAEAQSEYDAVATDLAAVVASL